MQVDEQRLRNPCTRKHEIKPEKNKWHKVNKSEKPKRLLRDVCVHVVCVSTNILKS